jgi:CRP-like cAMP-binding protein
MSWERASYVMYLAKAPMFSHCSEAQLERLSDLSHARGAAAGEELIREGEPADTLFVIIDGEAVVRRGGAEVAKLTTGDYFGEVGLLLDVPRSATVAATTPCTLAAIDRSTFRQALDEVPELRDALLRGMAHRLYEIDSAH